MTAGDLDRVLAINEASVPDVESLTNSEIAELFADSAFALVAGHSDDDVVGFGFAVGPGVLSNVKRTSWATVRDDVDLHLERIAFAPGASGFGLGVEFYDRLDSLVAERAAASGAPIRFSSFVTVEPLLEHSFNFHRARGFVEIDQLRLDSTTVALVQKTYDP